VVARDESEGRLGALSLRFVVPEAAGLRLSTPILTDRVATVEPSGPARPVLTAHRDFRPAGRLYCQFQDFGSAGAVPAGAIEASYALRTRDGQILRQSDPSPIRPGPDGRLVRLLALFVEGMDPGEYELVFRVEDMATGETRERVEALRIMGAPG